MHIRRLDTSTDSPDRATARARDLFDGHITACPRCHPDLCHEANALWRSVCVAALKGRAGQGAHF